MPTDEEKAYREELEEVLMRKPESMRIKHVVEAIEKAMKREPAPSDLDRFMDGDPVSEDEQEMLRQVISVMRDEVKALKESRLPPLYAELRQRATELREVFSYVELPKDRYYKFLAMNQVLDLMIRDSSLPPIDTQEHIPKGEADK